MNDDRNKPSGKEPQSYGSNGDWVSGKTSQSVERTQERVDRHDERFYESRHDATPSAELGGEVNSVQAAESDADPMDETAPPPRVTGTAATRVGTDSDQRKSFFRDRDYK